MNQNLFLTEFNNLINAVNTEIDEDNICLISQESLVEDHIKLYCGHRFNYNEIFNEVKKQKYDPYYYEVQKVGVNEIKCPYCRKKQKGILPYKVGYKKIKYVNIPSIWVMKLNNCKYTFKSGKRKGLVCNKNCSMEYCNRCNKYVEMRKKKQMQQAVLLENMIITSNNTNTPATTTCLAILKSGKRKGLVCNKKAKYNGCCGFHKKK